MQNRKKNKQEINKNLICWIFLSLATITLFSIVNDANSFYDRKRSFIRLQSLKLDQVASSPVFQRRIGQIAIDQEAVLYQPLDFLSQNRYSPKPYKEVAFTFDLGSRPGQIEKILASLEKYSFKATFFLTGKFIRDFPNVVVKIIDHGHEAANHSYNHIYFKDKNELVEELLATERVFYQATKKYMSPYWRAPYFQEDSKKNSWILYESERLGYVHFNAIIDSRDWMVKSSPCYTNGEQFYRGFVRLNLPMIKKTGVYRFCGENYRRLPNNLKFDIKGAIVLMHAESARDEDYLTNQLPRIFSFLSDKGYASVTLSELFNSRDLSVTLSP